MNAPIKGKHYKTGRPVEVSVEQGRITSVTELAESPARADWPWLAPGLVDLQVNGGWGLDLNTLPLQPATVLELSRLLLGNGVTSYCPTLITNGKEALAQAVSAIAEAASLYPEAAGGL